MFNRTDRPFPSPGVYPPGRHLMVDDRGYEWSPDSRLEARQLYAAYGARFVDTTTHAQTAVAAC